MTSERNYQRLIDDAILGELSPAKWAQLRAHLATCADCKQRYDRAVRVERFLDGKKAFSGGELARAEAAIFARLEPEKPRWSLSGAWVALTAVAAAALVVLALPEPRPDDVFRTRGSAGTASPRAGLVAVCVDPAGPARTLGAEGAASCPLGSRLELALANPGAIRHAFVVGVQSDRSPLWYSPRPPMVESPRAPDPAEGTVAIAAARLAVNHRPGPLRVYALFSSQPIHAKDVEAAIQKLPAGAPHERATLPISAPDLVQRSVLVEVTP